MPWWIPIAIEGARALLELLQWSIREKKKAEQLSALVEAWEKAGHYKDLLIQFHEQGVPAAKKSKARELRRKLEQLQAKLREIRRKIENDEDPRGALGDATELAREILTALLTF